MEQFLGVSLKKPPHVHYHTFFSSSLLLQQPPAAKQPPSVQEALVFLSGNQNSSLSGKQSTRNSLWFSISESVLLIGIMMFFQPNQYLIFKGIQCKKLRGRQMYNRIITPGLGEHLNPAFLWHTYS